MATGFGERIHTVTIYGPVSVNTSAATEMVDLLDFEDLEFHVHCGLLGSSDGTGTWVLIPYVSSTTTAAGSAIDFYYRLSATTAMSDSWGDVTSCANTGLSLTSDNDSMDIIIKLGNVNASAEDKRYAWIAVDASTDDNSTGLFHINALGIPRHAQHDMKSTTA